MGSKKVEKAIITYLRKVGGKYTTVKRDVTKDLLRVTSAKGVKREQMKHCIQRCIDSGKVEPITDRGRLVGLQLVA